MIGMRLEGTESDIKLMIKNLRNYYNITSVSKPYENDNNNLIRVYVKIKSQT